MVKLDKKDRKILLELDTNARQSYGEIAKKVWLSKASVMNRIKKMENEKIILNYLTLIDIMKLGYTTYDIYLKFNNTTPGKEQEIINFLTSHKKIWFVVSATGNVDLVVLISTKSDLEFYNVWEEILEKIKPFVRIVRTSILVEYIHYSRNYLSTDKDRSKKEIFVGSSGSVKLDEIDTRLLRKMSKNGRVSIVNLSKYLKLTPSAIIYRIKQLEKKGIIQGYRMNFNFSKYGFEYFKVFIELTSLETKKKIIQWLKSNKNVIYYDGFIGGCDLEFDLEIENTKEFLIFLENLKELFGKEIKEINHFIPLLFYKTTYFPDEE